MTGAWLPPALFFGALFVYLAGYWHGARDAWRLARGRR
jgi:hypothetical protein